MVQPTGSKSWALRYWRNGKAHKVTLGPVRELARGEREPPGALPKLGDPHSLAQARRHASELQHVVKDPASRIDIAALRAAELDLFEDVARKFIARYAAKSQRPRSLRKTIDALGFSIEPAPPRTICRSACAASVR